MSSSMAASILSTSTHMCAPTWGVLSRFVVRVEERIDVMYARMSTPKKTQTVVRNLPKGVMTVFSLLTMPLRSL